MNENEKKDYQKTYQKVYREKHKEEMKAYKEKHKEKLKAYQKGYQKGYRTNYKQNPNNKIKQKGYNDKYYQVHREKILKQSREYKKLHPEMIYKGYIKRNYGITLSDIKNMLRLQKNQCFICRKNFKIKKDLLFYINKTKRQLKPYCVDHDHKSKQVRGLLCHSCNSMLGQSKDSPEILNAGAKYLLE